MSLVRRSFSKHYCPKCGEQVSRAKPPFVENILQQLVLLVPFVFIWLVCAAFVERFGGGRLSALFVSVVVAWILLNPWFFAMSAFRCKSCGGIFRHHDLVCRGWGIVF